jgi:large subunit ribosomal protein L21
MFAVIDTLGRQYKVSVGDRVKFDRINNKGEAAAEGTQVTFSNVLLVGEGDTFTIGAPTISGAKVLGKILEQGKEKKVIAFKKKRRKGYSRKVGHRREYTLVQIEQIKAA